MSKTAHFAPVLLLALLAACGSATDASEEAMADTVEIPADQAMQNAPDPVPMVPEASETPEAGAEGDAAEGDAAEGGAAAAGAASEAAPEPATAPQQAAPAAAE